MIEKRYAIQLGDGVAPYSYTLSASDPCISFSKTAGTTDTQGNLFVTISALDSACIAGSTVTISGNDANGCPFSLNVPLQDPCDDLILNPIGSNSNYEFSVSAASPNCGSVDFTWTYDTSLFDKLRSIRSDFYTTLRLKPKTGVVLPATTLISVTATDCVCSKTAQLVYQFCRPTAPPLTVNLYCDNTGEYLSSDIVFPTPTGCVSTPDWNTLSIDTPDNIGYTATENTVSFSGTGLVQGTYLGKYSVQTTEGLYSTIGLITFIVHACDNVKTISAPTKTWYLDCSILPGQVAELNIENELAVLPGATIDWSTWMRIEPPESASPSIVLTTNSEGDHVIQYTVPNPFSADAFGWTIADTEGRYADAIAYTVSICAETPVAVADTFDVNCGATTTVNPLQNDLVTYSPLAVDSVVIKTAPTLGVASVNPDGTITYDVANGVAGTDTLTYTVKNVHGNESNAVLVTFNVNCSGINTNLIICE